jgi:uncharacterized coiled-coil protein SlyX
MTLREQQLGSSRLHTNRGDSICKALARPDSISNSASAFLMKTFSKLCLSAILCVPFSAPLSAQDAAKIDIDERRASVGILESHIAQRQARLDALQAEIRALDQRVEESVTEIVGMVSGIRDSVESQVRVAQLKADIVGGLRNSVEIYDRHRNTVREQLRLNNPAIPRETLQSDLDVFSKRIELRVEQIKKIAESFTDPRDLPKYEKTNTTSWGQWTIQNEQISDAWRQDRKESKHTESMQEQLIAALRDSITHLEQRNSLMAEKLKGQNITNAERQLYTSDLERNGALIESREAQIHSIQSNGNSIDEIEPLERNAAHETELFIRNMRADLKADFFTIFSKYAELNKERAELHSLTQNLAARKAWLKDYDAKQK